MGSNGKAAISGSGWRVGWPSILEEVERAVVVEEGKDGKEKWVFREEEGLLSSICIEEHFEGQFQRDRWSMVERVWESNV